MSAGSIIDRFEGQIPEQWRLTPQQRAALIRFCESIRQDVLTTTTWPGPDAQHGSALREVVGQTIEEVHHEARNEWDRARMAAANEPRPSANEPTITTGVPTDEALEDFQPEQHPEDDPYAFRKRTDDDEPRGEAA